MRKQPTLGDQEWQILQCVQEHGPASVRDVAGRFPQWARTTVLTVLERLRQKGFVQRHKDEGVFQYSARQEREQLVRRQIGDFVDKTLSGSVSPLFRYLSEETKLTEEERAQLEKIVARIGSGVDE